MYKNKLKELRLNKNIKQKDLAKQLNIKENTYSSYETEYDIIPLVHLNTLCNFFNVSFDYILDFSEIKNYKNNKVLLDNELTSKRLKELRKSSRISQKELAKCLNTSQSMISDYEKGKYIIPIIHLYYICKKYKISADYLLGKTDEPKYLK